MGLVVRLCLKDPPVLRLIGKVLLLWPIHEIDIFGWLSEMGLIYDFLRHNSHVLVIIVVTGSVLYRLEILPRMTIDYGVTM